MIRSTLQKRLQRQTSIPNYKQELNNKNSIVVDNISDLTALDTTDFQDGIIASTLGYYVPSDGGGARWEYVDSGLTADGYMIRNATGGGFWRMIYSGPLSVKWFGASGDDVADDTAAIQAAIDYIDAQTHKPTLFFPRGVYRVTDKINIPLIKGLKVIGENRDAVIIKQTANNTPILEFTKDTTNTVFFSDFSLVYESQQNYADHPLSVAICYSEDGWSSNAGYYHHHYHNLRISAATEGISHHPNLSSSQIVPVWGCTYDTIYFVNVSHCCINNMRGQDFGQPGNRYYNIKSFNPAENDTTGYALQLRGEISIRDLSIEQWRGRLIHAHSSKNMVMENVHIEHHKIKDDYTILFYVPGCRATVTGLQFNCYSNSNTAHRLFSGTSGSVIELNNINAAYYLSPHVATGYDVLGTMAVIANHGESVLNNITVGEKTSIYYEYETFYAGIKSIDGQPPIWHELPTADASQVGKTVVIRNENNSREKLYRCVGFNSNYFWKEVNKESWFSSTPHTYHNGGSNSGIQSLDLIPDLSGLPLIINVAFEVPSAGNAYGIFAFTGMSGTVGVVARGFGAFIDSSGSLIVRKYGSTTSDYIEWALTGFTTTYAGKNIRLVIAIKNDNTFAAYIEGVNITSNGTENTNGTPPTWSDEIIEGRFILGRFGSGQDFNGRMWPEETLISVDEITDVEVAAVETHGWPQHIIEMSYVDSVLFDNWKDGDFGNSATSIISSSSDGFTAESDGSTAILANAALTRNWVNHRIHVSFSVDTLSTGSAYFQIGDYVLTGGNGNSNVDIIGVSGTATTSIVSSVPGAGAGEGIKIDSTGTVKAVIDLSSLLNQVPRFWLGASGQTIEISAFKIIEEGNLFDWKLSKSPLLLDQIGNKIHAIAEGGILSTGDLPTRLISVVMEWSSSADAKSFFGGINDKVLLDGQQLLNIYFQSTGAANPIINIGDGTDDDRYASALDTGASSSATLLNTISDGINRDIVVTPTVIGDYTLRFILELSPAF